MTVSKIEWTATRNADGTLTPGRSDWNPLRGCTRVSPGCGGPGPHGGCYAEAIAARFSDPGQPFHGFAQRTKSGPRWTGKVELIEERLTAPVNWRKPARIFALSMSDLFHEAVPDEWIDKIFAVMALCPQHTFQVLTKRAERMRDYVTDALDGVEVARWRLAGPLPALERDWPLSNVWLGVSVEDQRRAGERIPVLLDTPAAIRFLSVEPMLEAIDLNASLFPDEIDRRGSLIGGAPYPGVAWSRLKWVVVGGESGPRARPFNIEWARSIIAQCKAAGVSVFMKQLGARPLGLSNPGEYCFRKLRDRKGGDPAEWPEDLRIREYPDPRGEANEQ